MDTFQQTAIDFVSSLGLPIDVAPHYTERLEKLLREHTKATQDAELLDYRNAITWGVPSVVEALKLDVRVRDDRIKELETRLIPPTGDALEVAQDLCNKNIFGASTELLVDEIAFVLTNALRKIDWSVVPPREIRLALQSAPTVLTAWESQTSRPCGVPNTSYSRSLTNDRVEDLGLSDSGAAVMFVMRESMTDERATWQWNFVEGKIRTTGFATSNEARTNADEWLRAKGYVLDNEEVSDDGGPW